MEQKIILCDTDAFIELMRQNPDVVSYLREIGFDSIYINPIIKAEIQFKAINKRDLLFINSRLEPFPVIPLDDDIADKFSRIYEKHLLSFRPSVPDMLIAATALSYDIPLFTLNLPHFAFISGLKLVKHTLKPLPRVKGSWFQ